MDWRKRRERLKRPANKAQNEASTGSAAFSHLKVVSSRAMWLSMNDWVGGSGYNKYVVANLALGKLLEVLVPYCS